MSKDRSRTSIAVVGAGLGGSVAAALLIEAGFNVSVYEQADQFTRLGAGIHVGPNVIKIMERLDVARPALALGCEPESWTSRDGYTGEVLNVLPLRGVARPRYGGPYITIHRGDFHKLLVDRVPSEHLKFGKKLSRLHQTAASVHLEFMDGSSAEADLLVGADGLNSRVREILLGVESPTFTGLVAYRGIIKRSQFGDMAIGDFTKWWGNNQHMVVYFMNERRDEVYFVAVCEENEWKATSSFVQGDVDEMRTRYKDFYIDARIVIDSAETITKWGLFERKPFPLWSRGRIVLLGDACHPMKPHMAQGAGMAMEDAMILARCLERHDSADYASAFTQYMANRIQRANDVQGESRKNRWLKHKQDADWVFAYDPVSSPLRTTESAA